MKLSELTKGIIEVEATDSEISNISLSSHDVQEGGLFIAIPGTVTDGHNFIDDAITTGAIAIVCEKLPKEQKEGVEYIVVENTQKIVGMLASRFYGDPTHKMQVVGVTGTNGKTTTATLLYNLFEKMGYKTGILSTLGDKAHGKDLDIKHTSPTTQDSIEMQKGFKQMVDAGCEYCFMEVSSHALDQDRARGIEFTGAIFSNATHEHLDYHVTFEEYLKAKRGLFELLHPHAWALTNADDENGEFMLQSTAAAQHYYGLQKEDGGFAGDINFEGIVIENSFSGLVLSINGNKITSRLIGKFNAYNLLAIFGAAMLLQQDSAKVAEVLADLHPADGRFDVLYGNTGKVGIIDYAHTPDAIENVLSTINEIKKDDQKVITVIGCGGDRDKKKRPQIARIAQQLSDYVVLTSDNPRSEEALAIIEDMKAGLDDPHDEQIFITPDRAEAIDTAVYTARENDIVLVAGKGHENYQEIKGTKYDFSDREVLEEKLRKYS